MRNEDEIPNPEGRALWDQFKVQVIPYLANVIHADLFSPGREKELLEAVCFAIYRRIEEDQIPMSDALLKNLLCDVCSLVPAFKNIQNIPTLVDEFFKKRDMKPNQTSQPTPLRGVAAG